ncbi:MAG: hypothetical protein ACKVG6_13465 [Alphaproteobacteria bacterium]
MLPRAKTAHGFLLSYKSGCKRAAAEDFSAPAYRHPGDQCGYVRGGNEHRTDGECCVATSESVRFSG